MHACVSRGNSPVYNHIHSVACKYGMYPFVGVSVYTSYLPVAEILLWILHSNGRSPFNGVA